MSAPAYDLAGAGIASFNQSVLNLQLRKIPRDPLRGTVDGSNKVFYANYSPFLSSGSSPLEVYVSGALVTGGSADYESGEVVLASAPAAQPKATYTHTPYTGRQVLRFMMNGLRELERRWSRGWQLLDGFGQPATEDSIQILVADKDGNDPEVGGGLVFSESFLQISTLLASAHYGFMRDVALTAARTDILVRETARGMLVDKSKRPHNLAEMIKLFGAELDDLIDEAQIGTLGYNPGGFIANPMTAEYALRLNWQAGSKYYNFRGQLGALHIPVRWF